MTAHRTTEAENKALIRRWFEEVWNQGREDLIEELRAPDALATGLGEGNAKSRGPDAFMVFFSNLRATLPDLHVTVEEVLAEGDKVAVRISIEGTHQGDALGAAPTGRTVKFGGISIARISDGRIAEAWNSMDQLGLLTQLGALAASPGKDRFLGQRL